MTQDDSYKPSGVGPSATLQTVVEEVQEKNFQPDSAGNIVIEADRYHALSQSFDNYAWAAVSEPSATSGRAMQIIIDTTKTYPSGNSAFDGSRLDYRVNFPSAGVWTIWVRETGPNVNSDSLRIGLNGMEDTNASPATGFGFGAVTWASLKNGTSSKLLLTVPSPGTHVLNIWERGAGGQAL